MKKLFFMSVAAFCMCTLSVTMISCGNDDNKTNPEPTPTPTPTPAPAPVEETQTVTFEGDYFTALIDNPQYMGPQLYPQGAEAKLYSWTDDATTLTSTFTDAWGDKQYWGGGIAISNYIVAELTDASYDKQLSVTKSNGTKNFAVVNGTAYMTLKTAKVIKSIDVMNTTYALNVIKNGNEAAKALVEVGSYFEVQVEGYKAKTLTSTVSIDLARDGKAVEDWKTIDMSGLEAVDSVVFKFYGSDASSYGVNTPAYMAIDNIVIKK